VIARFGRFHPADQADVIEFLEREPRSQLLALLTPEAVGTIIEEMDPETAIEISQDLGPIQLSQALDQASPDVAADVLRSLPQDVAIETLEQMSEAEDVLPLLEYEDDAAGGLMTPEFIALREDMTVAQALRFVQQFAEDLDPVDISYLMVVDSNRVLLGGVELGGLVLAQPYQLVSLVMDSDVRWVPTGTDQEECAHLMHRYNIGSLPVIDDDGKLVGVLKLEDMIGVLHEEATEDMYRMIGVGQEERVLGPFWRSVRSRLPWLCVNLATAVLAGLVITLFQSTMAQAVALAAFLPVIAGQGGIAGTQTLTLIVRSMALGEIAPGSASRLLLKEMGLGLVHGIALAMLVGIIAFVWQGNQFLALVVAAAMISNMVVAGISGVIVPITFKAVNIDPALASAVAVTTVTDVMGFLVYLGLATLAISLIAGNT
jgi:magnesium transporter